VPQHREHFSAARCAVHMRRPCPPNHHYFRNNQKRPYFVLVGGEGPCEDPLKRGVEHSSLSHIGYAYKLLRKHFARDQIIVICQLTDHREWLEKGPFRHQCMEHGAKRQLAHLETACRQLIAEGGAHYDGREVNAATVWATLLGLRPDSPGCPYDPTALETYTVTSQVQAVTSHVQEEEEEEGNEVVQLLVSMGFDRRLVRHVFAAADNPGIDLGRFLNLVIAANETRSPPRPLPHTIPLGAASSITLALYSHGDAEDIQLQDRAVVENTVPCDGCGETHTLWRCPRCGGNNMASSEICVALDTENAPRSGCEGPTGRCRAPRPLDAARFDHEYESRRTSALTLIPTLTLTLI